jgi:hypothetical protein
MEFYSYLWMREDGLTPYYAGKGCGKRAFHSMVGHRPPKDKSRIIIFPMLNEAEAIESEIALIELFGRKDIGTGILRNFTDGGDGIAGHVHSDESKRKMSEAKIGIPRKPFTEETLRRMSENHVGTSGKSFTEETKRKMSAVRKGRQPFIFTDEIRSKMSESAKKRSQTEEGKLNASRAGKLGADTRWGG